MRSATALCEAFTGQWLCVREGQERVTVCSTWQRLAATPVRAILGLDTSPDEGEPVPLDAEAYAVDIDASGDGWARVHEAADAGVVQVRFEAGLAAGNHWADLPEPLRQGILRLVSYQYGQRMGGSAAEPPAAVTALWRPWRRMRLA